MVESLVTICPRARRALVRMKMAGASRAISIMPKIGLNELRRLWMVPSSSDIPSTRKTSSWDLEIKESEICQSQSLWSPRNLYPILNTSEAESFQTSRRAVLSLCPNAKVMLLSLIFKSSFSSGLSIDRWISFRAAASSWPNIAAVNSRALWGKDMWPWQKRLTLWQTLTSYAWSSEERLDKWEATSRWASKNLLRRLISTLETICRHH